MSTRFKYEAYKVEYGYSLESRPRGVCPPEAAYQDRVRTVKHLVDEHNVDIRMRNYDEQTALDVAEENGYTECAAVLRGYGAPNGSP